MATANSFYFVSNLYTDSSYAEGLKKYENLPEPSRFWVTVKTDDEPYNPKYPLAMPLAQFLHEIGEAFSCMFNNRKNNLPYTNPCEPDEPIYDWVYGQPAIWGIYAYATPKAQQTILQAIKTGIRNTIQAELDKGRYAWKITSDQPINPPNKIPLLQQVKIQ